MTSRRDFLIAAGCVFAAGAGYQLKPRRYVSLLGKDTLANILPKTFGEWSSEDVPDALALNTKDSLSAQLYNQMVTRRYWNARTGSEIVILFAHGERQSDDLQLHRPEVCYPAFGYKLQLNEPRRIPLLKADPIPSRRLVAEREGEFENVVYWSRLGEYLPIDGTEQREDRFKNAFAGVIPDGMLCRFSTSGAASAAAWVLIETFAVELLMATLPGKRRVMLGTARAAAVASIPPPSASRQGAG